MSHCTKGRFEIKKKHLCHNDGIQCLPYQFGITHMETFLIHENHEPLHL